MVLVTNYRFLGALFCFFFIQLTAFQTPVSAGLSGLEVDWEPVGGKYAVPISENTDLVRALARLQITSGDPPQSFIEKFFCKRGLYNLLTVEGQAVVSEVRPLEPLTKVSDLGKVRHIFVDPQEKKLIFHTHKTHKNSFALFFDTLFTYDETKTCQEFSRKWLAKLLRDRGLFETFNDFLNKGYKFFRTASVQVSIDGDGEPYLQFYAVFDKRKSGPQETTQSPWLRPYHFVAGQELTTEACLANRQHYLSLVDHRERDIVDYLETLQNKPSPSVSPDLSLASSGSSSASSTASSSRRNSLILIDPGEFMSNISRLRINDGDTLEFEATDSIHTFLQNIPVPAQSIEQVDFSNGNPIPEFVIDALIEKWLLTLPNLRTVIWTDNFFTDNMGTSRNLYTLVSRENFECLDVSGTDFTGIGLDKFRDTFLMMNSLNEDALDQIAEGIESVDDQNTFQKDRRITILRKFKLN